MYRRVLQSKGTWAAQKLWATPKTLAEGSVVSSSGIRHAKRNLELGANKPQARKYTSAALRTGRATVSRCQARGGHWIWTSIKQLKVRARVRPPSCSPRPRPSPWPTCGRARPPAPLGCARSRRRALRQAPGGRTRRVAAQLPSPAGAVAASELPGALLPRAVRVRAPALAVQVGALSRAVVRPGRAPPPELGRAIPMMPSHRARLPERGRRCSRCG